MNPDELIYHLAKITLTVKLPGEWEARHVRALDISDLVAECLHPLPRDREIPFDPLNYAEAQRMERERERLASLIAKEMTHALLAMFRERDTVNGYPPEPAKPNP